MKQERFSKAEMLHHFELIMPKNSKGKAKYVNDSKFLQVCAKLDLVKCLNRKNSEYIFVKPYISSDDVQNIINMLKKGYKKYNDNRRNKPNVMQTITDADLDKFVKELAKTGLYEIRDGKVYKKVTVWKEL